MSVLCMRCSNKGCARVMASYAESSAVFKARCLAVGLEEADHEKLVQAGLKTLAQFAFCSAYVPGGTESDFVSVMTKARCRTGAWSDGLLEAPPQRRLWDCGD